MLSRKEELKKLKEEASRLVDKGLLHGYFKGDVFNFTSQKDLEREIEIFAALTQKIRLEELLKN